MWVVLIRIIFDGLSFISKSKFLPKSTISLNKVIKDLSKCSEWLFYIVYYFYFSSHHLIIILRTDILHQLHGWKLAVTFPIKLHNFLTHTYAWKNTNVFRYIYIYYLHRDHIETIWELSIWATSDPYGHNRKPEQWNTSERTIYYDINFM